jgi:PKD repeat protein
MQGRLSVLRRGWLVLLLTVLAMAASASTAGAVVVHLRNGQTVGVTPIKGVSSASFPGRVARRSSATSVPNLTSDNLSYGGGPVLHGVKPYLIFWDPNSQISAADKALYARFFADSAAASGQSTNVWAVDRQFTDSTGFGDYSQSWSPSHAITDTNAYPATGQCTEHHFAGEAACLYDGQLQTEVQRLISTSSLPDGIAGQAPLYFIVTPSNVNTCFPDNTTCADNFYCAYHSNFTDSSSNTVLYADIPTILAAQKPKDCQYDGNGAVQAPNGASTATADVVLKAISHEASETITDPVGGSGWVNASSGNEDGDQCNFTGAYDPFNNYNPNAFLPTLGGSAAGSPTYGTLYNQLINSHQYYIQSEWSNGDGNCTMQPTSSAISAAFIGPTSVAAGSPATFNPSASSSAAPYSSTTWSWGDGTSTFSPSAPSSTAHTFDPVHAAFSSSPASPLTTTTVQFDASSSFFSSTDNVTLTLVDQYGNLSSVAHPTSLTGAGGSMLTYSWSFDDGGTANTVNPSHQFTTSGQHLVTLTVGNGSFTDTTTQTVTVDAAPPPTAAFNVTTSNPTVGSPVSFDGSGSTETGGSIASYQWNFGDGATNTTSGAHPSHTYASAGFYTVTLTFTDAHGYTASVSHPLAVVAAPVSPAHGHPSAGFTLAPAKPVALARANFSGSPSTDIGSTLVSYAWNFGDRGTASGITSSHTYGRPGTYHVTLTVRDATGMSASSTRTVTVLSPGFTRVRIKTSHTVELIRLSLSGPGTLIVGRRHIRVRRAGVTTYRLVLSRAQRAKLHSHHRLHIKIAFRFAPKVGTTSRRTVAFTVKP